MTLRSALLLIALLGSANSWAGDSMRCGQRLVTVGASAADVLSACGEPHFRDVQSLGRERAPGFIHDAEQWTYNFGPNKLLHVLHLRQGRLSKIETEGYGFLAGSPGRCDPHSIIEGLTKFELLERCGPPFTQRDVGFVTALRPARRWRMGSFSGSRGHYPVEVYREEWTYNFGSRYFLRIVTLEDGSVARVENGDRGFNAR